MLSQAIGAVVIGAAVACGLWSLLHDRSRGRRRCPKCWYEIGCIGLVCPECGYRAVSRHALEKTRRHWRLAAIFAAIGTVGAGIILWPTFERWSQVSSMPAWLAIRTYTVSGFEVQRLIIDRLAERSRNGELRPDQQAALARFSLDRISTKARKRDGLIVGSDSDWLALAASGEHGASAVTPRMRDYLQGNDFAVRNEIIRKISVVGRPMSGILPQLRELYTPSELIPGAAKAAADLGEPPREVCNALLESYRATGNMSYLQELALLEESAQSAVRDLVALAGTEEFFEDVIPILGAIGGREQLPNLMLESALRRSDPGVRERRLAYVVLLSEADSVRPDLVRRTAAKEDDPQCLLYLATLYEQLADRGLLQPEMLSPLVASMLCSDVDARVWAKVAQLTREFGRDLGRDQRARRELATALGRCEAQIHEPAVECLLSLSGCSKEVVSRLICDKSPAVRAKTALALQKCAEDPQDLAACLMERVAMDRSESVRVAAIQSLSHLVPSSEEAMRVILRAMEDDSSLVRLAAVSAMWQFDVMLDDVVDALRTATHDDSARVCVRAVEVLALWSLDDAKREALRLRDHSVDADVKRAMIKFMRSVQ